MQHDVVALVVTYSEAGITDAAGEVYPGAADDVHLFGPDAEARRRQVEELGVGGEGRRICTDAQLDVDRVDTNFIGRCTDG